MRLYRYLDKNLFSPPFRLLPLTVFAFIVLAFLYHPQSPFRTFTLGDPDDYMRLNEVIAWLKGQGWYDLSHPRMSPGAHTVLHWSRLVDLPIAALMLPLIRPFGMMSAALVASFIVPLILLGFLLALLTALAEPLVGKDRANLATVFLLFAPLTLFNFTPGRVDHHNWEILIGGFGLLCLERLTRDAKNGRFAIYAAIAFACGLWIGTEALPWLMLFIACLAVAGAWQGGFTLRNAAVFGAALPLAMACVLPLALPPSEWHSRALSWFSPAYVIFAALTGGMLIAVWFLGQLTKKRPLRIALLLAFGFFAASLFFLLVPEALGGPFADFDDFDITALGNIGEALPMARVLYIDPGNPATYLRTMMLFSRYLLPSFVALIAIGYALRSARRKDRAAWIFTGVYLLTTFLLAIFWQVRAGWFMQMLAIAPLTWLIIAWWKKIGRSFKGRARFWAEVGAFCVLAPLPVLLIPAAVGGMKLYPDLILFPATRGDQSTCPLKQAAEFIASPFGRYTRRPVTILSGANEGPELLFRTPDNVIAGNFIVPGNKDVFDFFHAREEKSAVAILRKWHVDLILICRSTPPFYAGLDHPRPGANAFLHSGPDGKLYLVTSLQYPAMIEKLVNGPLPHWLKPVEIPTARDYLLFEVRLPRG